MRYINGNSMLCRDCQYYEPEPWREKKEAQRHDGRCTNAKHVKTHGGGHGWVERNEMACFDAEVKT